MNPWEKKQIAKEKEKVKELCIDGLLEDGAHHKQWYLERILEAAGFDLREICHECAAKGYIWEGGIAP